eukprot:TRINITY_DN4936_c0_g1_i1.p1 TRINITY_DN4936_c0_g1~~TRINITY_DN4936_c0_g1_i1.p1  ORF type:complete len:413 (+),score=102.17 TRINITY_DN4936_c0_g1_i1:104-1342(+)
MKACVLFALIALVYSQSWSHTGYIQVNPQENAQLFYWLFDSQKSPSTDPLVLWLTGGPGCSSELALFFENGPWNVNTAGTNTTINPYSWNKFANLLYVDQPCPTGFSTCNEEYISNEGQVVTEMLAFLEGFIQAYPQFVNRDFYIVGESYGGHYVPAIANGIVSSTKLLAQYNLKAIGVGNGWVDPYIQYNAYGSYAYANNLINNQVWSQMNQTYAQCATDLDNQDWQDASQDCGSIMQIVLEYNNNLNWYNIKLPCVGSLCYDFTNIDNYLNTPSVQQSIGVNGIQWEACNYDVNAAFYQDTLQSYATDLPAVLAAGVRVVIYNGDLDLICNWMGGQKWTNALQWPGQQAFNSAPVQPWTVSGTPAGTSQAAQGFTFVRVYNAGHMVPHDQPAVALQLLQNIITGSSFVNN